ncbi:hypothetical protein BDV25DRAFT_130633 [Aspergillus avenaceus]|uniref:UDP-Glycosyltransferase/glycogen phosphorylase n=1 Tax=Aspergillus avenaceus TaxID=36643 RepID=A0A5N6TRZ6_ASPAV|nr:hypothetical protein BDV25DRAFT_130633 [Aspergillus avenaceus]
MAETTILFLTYSELGQATIMLAVAHEFLLRPSYDVHIGSFPSLEPTVSEANARAVSLASASKSATFHRINGLSFIDTPISTRLSLDPFKIHTSGFQGALNSYEAIFHMSYPWTWTDPEYKTMVHDCATIIQKLRPHLVVLDPFFSQAVDACRMLEQRYVGLSPNTFKEHVVQPWLEDLWKHPAAFSGYPYPLPWRLILPNAYLVLRRGWARANSKRFKDLVRYRKDHGMAGPLPGPAIQTGNANDYPILLPTRKETEYPCYLPDNFTQCGPILRPSGPITEEDPDLASWLARHPTVLVNLGSHLTYTDEVMGEFMKAFRMLWDKRPGVQILWKILTKTGKVSEEALPSDLRAAIAGGQVRVESWLAVEPVSILKSGHVQCMVHHGGSNSYHEAIAAGVPQVVLPVWYDTYDFASRAEWLGVGLRANQKNTSAVDGIELGQTLIRMLASDEGLAMQDKAKAIAAQLGPKPGRVIAKQLTFTTMASETIAWIGLGNIGRGMSRNISQKGPQSSPIVLYNRTIAKAQAFAESIGSDKATVASTIPEAVKQATISFICVGDDPALDQIINTLTSDESLDLTGKIIVDCSTVHPDTSRRTCATLLARGATFIACPVFGAPNMADAGQLIVIPAGKPEAIERLNPFLECVTAKATIPFPGDDVGRATQLKVVGNTFILNTVETIAESLVLAEKSGLGAEAFQTWIHTWLPGPFAKYADRMVTGDYYKRDEPLMAVDLSRKDLGHASSIASQAGVRLRSTEVTDGYLQEVKKEKGEKGDLAGVYGAIRKEAGLEYDN